MKDTEKQFVVKEATFMENGETHYVRQYDYTGKDGDEDDPTKTFLVEIGKYTKNGLDPNPDTSDWMNEEDANEAYHRGITYR